MNTAHAATEITAPVQVPLPYGGGNAEVVYTGYDDNHDILALLRFGDRVICYEEKERHALTLVDLPDFHAHESANGWLLNTKEKAFRFFHPEYGASYISTRTDTVDTVYTWCSPHSFIFEFAESDDSQLHLVRKPRRIALAALAGLYEPLGDFANVLSKLIALSSNKRNHVERLYNAVAVMRQALRHADRAVDDGAQAVAIPGYAVSGAMGLASQIETAERTYSQGFWIASQSTYQATALLLQESILTLLAMAHPSNPRI